jgi:hypothetical protein
MMHGCCQVTDNYLLFARNGEVITSVDLILGYIVDVLEELTASW